MGIREWIEENIYQRDGAEDWLTLAGGIGVLAFLLLAALLIASCMDYDVADDGGDHWPPKGEQDDDDAGGADSSSQGDDDAGADHDDGGPGDDDTGDDDTGDDDADPADDDSTPWDDDETPGDDDTEEEDCPNGIQFTVIDPDNDGQVAVLSWSPTEDEAIIQVSVNGVYDIYDSYTAESGASQQNETGWVQITNSVNPQGYPVNGNCGNIYLVQDNDNNGAPTQPVYLGTFPLKAGEDNLLTLYHYCPIYRTGQCQGFHIGDANSGSGCNTNNANSIHLDLSGLCIEPW